MSDNKIAEIRKRHEQSEKNYIELESTWKAQIHEDRSFLLAEVERHRAEIERLLQAIGLVTTAVPDMEIDIENPVGMAQRVVAEFKKLRADRRERIATAALNGLIANAVVAHTPAQFALAAVVVADALIAELDKEGGKP